MNKYKRLYSNLLERRTDHTLGRVALSEAIQKSHESESLRYLKASMEAVPTEYTEISFREANRVKDALAKDLAEQGVGVEFDYQGSTTNNTHIKAKSDIDLLALRTEFFTLKPPLTPTYPYQGNPLQDLIGLRRAAIDILDRRFWAAEVGKDSPMCIPIEGGSLLRKVDVVPSNWYHTQEYQNTKDKSYLGIQVLDSSVPERVVNFPFLHNQRLGEKDRVAMGRAKPLIRCLKNIIADNTEIKISSYNVAGLAYNLPNDRYASGLILPEVKLLSSFVEYSRLWESSSALRGLAMVPNGTRHLFSDFHSDGITVAQLSKLNDYAEELLTEIQEDTMPLTKFPTLAATLLGK